MAKGEKVCRDENFARGPSLQDALAYEAIYGLPVRELFAGVYQQAEEAVAARAKILSFRKLRKTDARKQAAIIQLAAKAVLIQQKNDSKQKGSYISHSTIKPRSWLRRHGRAGQTRRQRQQDDLAR